MAERIASGTTPLAIDPGARALIRPAGESSGFASEATMHVSTVLANQVPGVSLMTIEELLDFRDQNLAYLTPFRAAILDIAKEISTTEGMSPAEIERLTKIAWARDAAPALKELEFQLDEAGFGRTFIQTLVEDKGAGIAAGASLVMGFGTLFAGFAALLPATVAAAYPIAKTFYARTKSERAAKQNRLYFVYKAGKRSKGKGEA